MAKGIPVMGRMPNKKAKIINVDEQGNLKVSQLESKLDGIENKLVALEQKLTDGSQKVQLKGRIDDLEINRPAANSVDKGTVFWAVDTGEVSVSTGTEWRRLGVV